MKVSQLPFSPPHTLRPFAALGTLAETYVNAIRSGSVPCIENAVVALAKIENATAVQAALQRYDEMVEHVAWSMLPTESTEELLEVHAELEKEAIQVFMARAFKDEEHEHQRQLGVGDCFLSEDAYRSSSVRSSSSWRIHPFFGVVKPLGGAYDAACM